MIVPLFVGREKSIRALEEVMKADKPILLATQKNAADDDPAPEAIFATGTLATRAATAEAARRHRQGAGRRRESRAQDARLYAHGRGLLRGRGRGGRRRPDRADRGRGAVALGRLRVRELRQAQQEDLARSGRRGHADRRLRQARRHDRLASRGQARRQAGDPRDPFDRQALREVPRPDGERNLGAAGREAHPHARQAADGEDAARVLSQRADEGDPEGARRRGRQGRDVRAGGAHQGDQADQGSARQGDGRAEEAAPDVADVGRGDGGAQLPRLAAVDPVAASARRSRRTCRPRRRSSTPTISASTRSRTASSNISPCSSAPTS